MNLMRLVGRGGGALPGLVVERVYNVFLPKALAQLPKGVVVITGTNGKTTSNKALSELLGAHGLRVLTNQTGGNFVRGAISTVLDNISWSGKLPYDIAVLELDEAHAVPFVALVKPNGVIALNVMRDQMDRFGEIDTTARLIGSVIDAATDWVVLNANDPRIAGLQTRVHAPKTIWFGHSESLTQKFLTDDQHHHDEVSFYEAQTPTVRLEATAFGRITILVNGKKSQFAIKLEGTHNAINIAAVLAALDAIVPDSNQAVTARALADISPAFGRGERLTVPGGGVLQLQLVKNPGGFTHALRILDGEPYSIVGIAINDEYADGRDVSWLWDVDFDSITSPVITGGTRGTDMAVRLKYDGVASTNQETLDGLLEKVMIVKAGERAILFCTYNAMLSLRKLLRRQGIQIEEVGL